MNVLNLRPLYLNEYGFTLIRYMRTKILVNINNMVWANGYEWAKIIKIDKIIFLRRYTYWQIKANALNLYIFLNGSIFYPLIFG
jgi:hypothetical protein